jgi:ATP-dependent helicase/nuclease subunit B
MDDVSLLPVALVEALERGAVVVTSNQRAARSLRRAFDRRNRELGLDSWRPPAILAWDAWTTGLWRGLLIEGKATQLLLNRSQEHAVWRRILAADAELKSLRSADSLADMAADAWRRLCAYNGRARLGAGWSADTRSFQRWALAFEGHCRREGLLSVAQLEETLRMAVEAGTVTVPAGGVALVGFDGMTPAQMGLKEGLHEAGVEVVEIDAGAKAERLVLAEAVDERAELIAAARWVRRGVEEQRWTRVGVIVPGLAEERAGIDRVFREVLAAELEDICAAEGGGPYEFSLGVALAKKAMVTVALDVMRWVAGALPLGRVSALLVSPYFGGGFAELEARAAFDAFELRKARMLRPEVTLEWMISKVEGSRRRGRLTGLLGSLRGMRMVGARRFGAGEMRLHAEWAEAVRELLSTAGWGEGRMEDSVEFQVRRKWESALDELATLDFDGMRVEFTEALAGLERIVRETTFAPESGDAPVQVMGPLEAAGERFDAVWFLRAGDLCWPEAAGISPLLPWSLQSELKMPGTDTARDGEQARRITERIAQSAGVVVFSYAREVSEARGEGRQRPSSALGGLELERVACEDLVSEDAARTMVRLEEVMDVARIETPPDVVMRGGANVLKLQAACGFRAFAEMRLHAAELEDVELGMDARERGNVVHKVLEAFWELVKTQSALKAMREDEREEKLSWAVNEGLKRTAELSETAWDEEYVEVQRERMKILLRPWLAFEMGRPAFEVKLVEEKLAEVKVGPLRLDVRVDRVDETKGGDLVIDYKTGLVETNGWLSSRPDEPQLPLYAMVSEVDVLGGVAFGLVRAGKSMEMKAFVANGDVLIQPKKAPKMDRESFAEQVEEWQRVLTKLAEDFYRGDTRVRPKDYPVTCKHCGQRLLCRLDAAALGGDDEFETEGIDG